jgi:hypothetical protein
MNINGSTSLISTYSERNSVGEQEHDDDQLDTLRPFYPGFAAANGRGVNASL